MFLFAAFRINSVKGEGPTTLSIQPGNTTLIMGRNTTVEMQVVDGVEINAYDILIKYDAAIVTLESWSHGPYLSNLAVLLQDVQPGMVHLVATQLARPGVSGDGVLLSFVFSGASPGSSAITIESAELALSSGGTVIPTLDNGVILVTTSVTPSFTPTPTATKTPTCTATQTRTNTPTPGLTRSATATPMVRSTSTHLATKVTAQVSTGPFITGIGNTSVANSTLEDQLTQSTRDGAQATATKDEKPSPQDPMPLNPTRGTDYENNGIALVNTILWVVVIALLCIFAGLLIWQFIFRKRV